MRIIFMGTPEFSVPALEALKIEGYNIVGVFTQPPRPKGRGYEIQKSPVHLKAEELGIPVFTPEKLREAEDQKLFIDLKPDIAIVAAYGLILPKIILTTPKYGCINIHASLLPRWRGAAPLQRAILAGDYETGICIMQMDEGLDTGSVWSRATTPITNETTCQTLHDSLAKIGADLLIQTMPIVCSGFYAPTTQLEDGVTYASKITKQDGLIDWHKPAEYIIKQIRALSPWPGIYFEFNNVPFKVIEANVANETLSLAPGCVHQEGKKLIIGCGSESALDILTIQKSGGKPLTPEAFNNGFSLPQRL